MQQINTKTVDEIQDFITTIGLLLLLCGNRIRSAETSLADYTNLRTQLRYAPIEASPPPVSTKPGFVPPTPPNYGELQAIESLNDDYKFRDELTETLEKLQRELKGKLGEPIKSPFPFNVKNTASELRRRTVITETTDNITYEPVKRLQAGPKVEMSLFVPGGSSNVDVYNSARYQDALKSGYEPTNFIEKNGIKYPKFSIDIRGASQVIMTKPTVIEVTELQKRVGEQIITKKVRSVIKKSFGKEVPTSFLENKLKPVTLANVEELELKNKKLEYRYKKNVEFNLEWEKSRLLEEVEIRKVRTQLESVTKKITRTEIENAMKEAINDVTVKENARLKARYELDVEKARLDFFKAEVKYKTVVEQFYGKSKTLTSAQVDEIARLKALRNSARSAFDVVTTQYNLSVAQLRTSIMRSSVFKTFIQTKVVSSAISALDDILDTTKTLTNSLHLFYRSMISSTVVAVMMASDSVNAFLKRNPLVSSALTKITRIRSTVPRKPFTRVGGVLGVAANVVGTGLIAWQNGVFDTREPGRYTALE